MNNSVPSKPTTDVYQSITRKIVLAIQQGADAFTMPWHARGSLNRVPTNAATGMPYKGVNVIALWAEAMAQGHADPLWATYRQWAGLGAQVRRGERGATIVFYKTMPKAEADKDDGTSKDRLVARASTVFNLSQVDGWSAEPFPEVSNVDRVPAVEIFVSEIGAVVEEGGDVACYRPAPDVILMPSLHRFRETPSRSASEAYYATLLHELTHWTGAETRLNRTFGSRFGDHAYAFEELVAELGSAFLCADLGLANEPRPDHAAYINEWLTVLDGDARAIFTASRLAQQAADFLRYGQPPF